MPTKTKYKSKVVFWNSRTRQTVFPSKAYVQVSKHRRELKPYIYRFDSTLEFNVYLRLIELHGINCVDRQIPLLVQPPTRCIKTGRFWKVDFGLKRSRSNSNHYAYVEAKGLITSEFSHKLPMLELNNVIAFEKLHLVFGKTIPKDHAIMRNLLRTDFSQRIYTLNTIPIIQ